MRWRRSSVESVGGRPGRRPPQPEAGYSGFCSACWGRLPPKPTALAAISYERDCGFASGILFVGALFALRKQTTYQNGILCVPSISVHVAPVRVRPVLCVPAWIGKFCSRFVGHTIYPGHSLSSPKLACQKLAAPGAVDA